MENFDLDIALQDAEADYNAAEAQAIFLVVKLSILPPIKSPG